MTVVGLLGGLAQVTPAATLQTLVAAFETWKVEKTAEFAPALDSALKKKGLRLIHCKTDVEQISNATTITNIRGKSKKA